MRALFDLSRTLMCASIMLLIANFINMTIYMDLNAVGIIRSIILLLLVGITYMRTEKFAKYKVRMVMGVYDACVTLENARQGTHTQ